MITWYSMNKNLAAVDREAVSKDDAMMIIDGYFSRLRAKYESGEEAIAETMFGFQRRKGEFVEICINGPDTISFNYEVSSPKKILFLTVPSVFQKELTLHTIESVKAKVADFFELDPVSFRAEIGG